MPAHAGGASDIREGRTAVGVPRGKSSILQELTRRRRHFGPRMRSAPAAHGIAIGPTANASNGLSVGQLQHYPRE